ncbi:unnamed protein product [Urochloa humidicola]
MEPASIAARAALWPQFSTGSGRARWRFAASLCSSSSAYSGTRAEDQRRRPSTRPCSSSAAASSAGRSCSTAAAAAARPCSTRAGRLRRSSTAPLPSAQLSPPGLNRIGRRRTRRRPIRAGKVRSRAHAASGKQRRRRWGRPPLPALDGHQPIVPTFTSPLSSASIPSSPSPIRESARGASPAWGGEGVAHLSDPR